MASATEMKTQDLHSLLEQKFQRPEWAIVREVGNATGITCNRHADALALNLWPSRGMELHGFELKLSRGDWKRELDNPAKAESILRFCDRWWIVAGDAKIVLPGELPPTW